MPTFTVEYLRADMKQEGVRSIDARDFQEAIALAPVRGWVVRSVRRQFSLDTPFVGPRFIPAGPVSAMVFYGAHIAIFAMMLAIGARLWLAAGSPIGWVVTAIAVVLFAVAAGVLVRRRTRRRFRLEIAPEVIALEAASIRSPPMTWFELRAIGVAVLVLSMAAALPFISIIAATPDQLQFACRFLGFVLLPVYLLFEGYRGMKARLYPEGEAFGDATAVSAPASSV